MNATHELSRWLAAHAQPLPLDPAVQPVTVPEILARAEVVGLASSVRSARQLVLATHVLLHALVEQAGFRAVLIEGTEETGPALDRFVRTGEGDPAELLATSQSFLRVHEALDVIRWLRSWCEQHPDDPVSIVHDLRPPATPPDSLAQIEEDLARTELLWHSQREQRIVHWGGTAHVIVGDPRTVPPDHTHRNAGGILRAEMGHRYAVAALTLGSGHAPFRIPPPPSDFTEHALAEIRHDAALLHLDQRGGVPRSVTDWLHRPLRTRMIGPTYDPAHDHDFRVDAGPLHHCADILVYAPRVTATRPL
ncbi:erythromycin esterase family protein [Glycomyces tenuis]|uniref:erythromycin esterase family protein n=1 Tax=Glycomyces tenuis TaxID=58116 RepID=UPI00047EBACE|nr:erythromycin esterase family protein [Glycomyces tenuis]